MLPICSCRRDRPDRRSESAGLTPHDKTPDRADAHLDAHPHVNVPPDKTLPERLF